MSNLVATKSWPKGFRFWRTVTGDRPDIAILPVAASQTIVEGDPLTLSAGVLSLATASSTSIAGVAAGNVTTTAANEKTPLIFYKATAGNIFCARCDAASNTVAEGDKPGIRTSGGIWYVNIADANATNVVNVKGHVGEDDVTDSTYYGRVFFTWNRSPWFDTNS